MEEEKEIIAGLDVGKLSDHTAFALFERKRPKLAPGELRVVDNKDGMGPQTVTVPPRLPFSGTTLTREERRQRQWRYRLMRMKRWDVGTSYEEVLGWLTKAYSRPPSQQGLAGTTLAVDYTGVGVAVFEWLGKEMQLSKSKALLRPIWITGGQRAAKNEAGGWNVPKRELVSVLQVLMGTGRLQIEQNMENCGTLVSELTNFKSKINVATGNESLEAWRERDHDDCVLACATGLWVGEQGNREFWVR